MNLRLYQYNNYYNRTIKPMRSWQEMSENYEIYVEYNTNFNPNDGITTKHIIGGASAYYGDADYCVVEENNNVVSRWFILENRRTRGGQYEITLKRDTVAEYQEAIMSAPCFVEKGWIPDTDPAIFNKENMTYNQIKKSEVLLKDKTKVPWLVGYYAKNETMTTNVPRIGANVDYTISGISNWINYAYTQDFYKEITELDFTCFFKGLEGQAIVEIEDISESGNRIQISSAINNPSTPTPLQHYTILTAGYAVDNRVLERLVSNIKAKSRELFAAAADTITNDKKISNLTFRNLVDLEGKTIYDSLTGKLYKIGYEMLIGNTSFSASSTPALTSTFGYEMYNVYAATDGIIGNRPTSNGVAVNFGVSVARTNQIKLTLIPQSIESYTVTLSPEGGTQSKNSPYNIFAMPYGEIQFGFPQGNGTYLYKKSDADMSMRLCMGLISQHSGSNAILYDVQLLPYCPIAAVREKMEDSVLPTYHLDNIGSTQYTTITDSEGEAVGVAFYVVDTQHQITIDYSINVDNIKVSNETEFCRLVSPNWNGMFEFSPAKNYGVEYFTVDYELKPFAPYIHVSPKWNQSGLYGNRDNDPIGLICGGDFGLTMISDAWATYERQNKNYQNIFDRQIQNLEVQNTFGLVSDIAGASVGAVQGGASGAMIGMMAGGGIGGSLGAGLSSGLLSAGGGVADVLINETLRKESMDYTKDLFGYQMGNIKALPQSLTRVNSFNPNNTIFPILEFYGATEKEVAALENKLIYNGMTIGRIGQLKDYTNPTAKYTYLKGQLIILEDFDEDSHFVNDIAAEINKGVRI